MLRKNPFPQTNLLPNSEIKPPIKAVPLSATLKPQKQSSTARPLLHRKQNTLTKLKLQINPNPVAHNRTTNQQTLLHNNHSKFMLTAWKLPDIKILALIVSIFLIFQQADAGCVTATLCDNSYVAQPVTTSGGTTVATDLTTSMTTAYLDPVATKPLSGAWYVRGHYPCTSTWANCVTGSNPLLSAYTAQVSPAACQSLLYWDAACTLPCTATRSVDNGAPVTITAKVTNINQAVTTTDCTLGFVWKNSAGTTVTNSWNFNVVVKACDANSLAWTTAGFSIAAQTYYVYDAAKTITASLATQTKACGYAVSYAILVQTTFAAADSTVFTLTSGTPNTISIATNLFSKVGTYNLVYRASMTNLRTPTPVVTLDATFTVTIIDRCATTSFNIAQPTINTMATTALSVTSHTQVLTYKDSVSSANGNSDGVTYCGNRVFTIDSGMSPQTFLTVTSNSLTSTITLQSNQLSDATACATCTVRIKVCFVNYPTLCTTTSPETRASIPVTIGACVVTSYTAAAYPDFSYTIRTASTFTPYPTFTQTPACAYTFTKTVTVNSNPFPGTNLNGGTSMAAIFGDDTANKRFTVVDNTLLDGTNTYTFAFTSTLSSSPPVSTTSTFKIILVNPCLSTVIQDNGQTMTFSGSEMMATATTNYAPFTQFKNSYAISDLTLTTGCGPYTYSLTSYTGTFMIFNSATQQLQLKSISTTDSTGSPYTIGLQACLTNYPTIACFVKTLTVTIADCIISTYTMTSGQTALSTAPAKTYTIGATALIITLPTFTQNPLCAYTETKSCYLTASPTACPSWVTATQTTWTIYCTTPATCAAANYNLVMVTALNNSPVSSVTQTQTVTIIDPCTLANGNTIAAGTVASMTTSALSTTAVTQTLTASTNSASTNAGVASMCGASTFSLVAGTYSATYLSLTGSTLTLLSTSISDVGTHNNVQVKQCLSTAAYNTVCQTFSFTVTVTACLVASWTPVPLATQIKYINDASTTSSFTTWTQAPACAYTYTTAVSISGTTISATAFKGVTLAAAATLGYYDTTRTDAGTYTITFTPTVTASCAGVCTITAATTTLVWKDPCQKTVLSAYTTTTLPSKVTTALGPLTTWTFAQLTDNISTANAPSDGVTYCGDRTYTFTGQGTWLTFTQGTGTAINTLSLQSTTPTDYSATPYTITLAVSLPQYSDVPIATFTFTITINPCVLTSITVTGSIADQSYIVGDVQQSVAFPTYTQVPACNYAVAYTFKRGIGSFVTSDTLMSVTSQTQFDIGVATDTALSGTTSLTHSITLQATFANSPPTVNTATNFNIQVVNPCATTSWVARTITVAPISLQQVVPVDMTIKDLASLNYGTQDGISLCGLRTYSWSWVTAPPLPIIATQIQTTKAGDTLRFNPTVTAHQGTYTVQLTACLTPYIPITSCYVQNVVITINPCQVFSNTKSGGDIATFDYIPYTSGTLSYTFPTYTQTPACGYVWVFTLMRQDNTALQSLFTQTASPGYQILSNSVSDAGTYPLKLRMTLAGYPTQFIPYVDETLKWTVTVTNPCLSATLNAFTSNFATMTASVSGPIQYQRFSNPTDSFSVLRDLTLDYFPVSTPYVSGPSYVTTPVAAVKGTNVCGARQYVISPASCQPYLFIDTTSQNFPVLQLAPTLASQVTVTAGVTCTVTASLTNYPTITPTARNVLVKITACVLVSLTLATTPPAMIEYDLVGAAKSVSFPTYIQTPACNYAATYACHGAVHTAAMQTTYPAGGVSIPSPTSAISTIPALANTVKCDTPNLKVVVDIKTFVPALTSLATYQYQGDYNLRVAVTVGSITATNYVFQLRMINPCWSYNTVLWVYTPTVPGNVLTPSSIQDMQSSVLLASQPIVQTWTAFQDTYSTTRGNSNGYTLCGTRTYSLVTPYSWLSMTTPAATPNANTFSVNSVSSLDVGYWTVTIDSYLTSYPNITASTSFTVHIGPCTITALNAPTLAAQSYKIFTDPQKIISIPTYTQVPACNYPVTYTSSIKKISSANSNRLSLFPDYTAQYSINSLGITSINLYFIKRSGSNFLVYTDELMDGGIYTVYVSATAIQTSPLPAFTNTALSFQLTLVDPCQTTLVNNIAANPTLNRVATNIETSVKYSGGLTIPSAYVPIQYQFYTFMDSVSVAYDTYFGTTLGADTEYMLAYKYPYTSTSLNDPNIYCGPRTYVLGGAGNPLPAWLSFDPYNGIFTVQTADDAMVNYSPGHQVTLQACLQYYPTVCSAAVTYTVIINECKVMNFVYDSLQLPIHQYIYDAAVTQNIVSYTQTPLCGWTLTYTAVLKNILQPYNGTATTNQAVSTGSPAWATLDTTTTPLWTMQSKDHKDATTFTITQIVTLNDKIKGVSQNTNSQQDFDVTFSDPCWFGSFVLQNGVGETFDTTNITPLIRTSVKFGMDNGATPLGAPVSYQFDFHNDTTSDRLPVASGTPDSSNWVCGPRTYSVIVTTQGTASFMSVVDSPAVSTLVKPELKAMTSLDSDIGTWLITLTVQLTRYPTVTATENFYVMIDQCILNTLTVDFDSQIRSPADSPLQFILYANLPQQVAIPTYTQAPACGYPLSYTLTQIQTWTSAIQAYDPTPIICPFASLNSVVGPSFITFQSSTWTDDPCDYGTGTICNLANSRPYELMLTAYVDSALILTDIEFPTTQNQDEKFYVLPQDPCYSTTLFPGVVPFRNYFLGDSSMRISVPITQDIVSQDPGYQYFVDGTGYDKCGPRTYQIFTSANAMPTFASVPLQQDPPVISVQTNNPVNVGAQSLNLLSGLANYPQITASMSFTLMIYNFKLGKAISLQYYQITKPALVLTWAQFTISPAPPAGTMLIYYMSPDVIDRKTGLTVLPPPAWLTVDTTPSVRTLKVYTNAFADQGVYDIIIYAGVTGYSFRANQTITVNITKTPPPQLSTAPPNFTLPLVNQEFKMADGFTFTLPATQSVGNFAVKATMTQGPKWLSFDSKTLTFTVKQGGTKLTDTGDFTIQITLLDTAGGKGTYNFKLTCIAPPVVVPVVFPTTAAVAYPVPKITKITNKGVVTVIWDQQMRIPRNLTQVSNGTCNYVNPTTYDIERQPNLDVQVMPGNGNEGKDLTFTWNFTGWDTKAMTLQLYFNSPLDVSYGIDPERLKLIFYGMPQFVSQTGIPVNGGRDQNKNSIPIFTIPAQIAINQAPVVRRNNKAGMSTGQIGPMIFQLGISSLLNSVWGMVDTQQIIILLPLFDIVLPENAQAFFAQLMTIAAFAIIPTDPIFGWMFDAPPNNLPLPLSDNFMNVGFATTYITNNMGTLFFSLMYLPVMVCVYYVLKRIPIKRIMTYRVGLGRNLFWSNTFQTFSDQFTIIATCSLIQLAYLDWETNYGTKFCSFLGCLYTGVCVTLPFVVAYVCWKNYDLIKSGDKVFKQRFNSMWSGLSTEDRGFIVYHWYFLLRRFLIGVLCVFSRKSLFFQISGLVFNIIFATIVAGNTQCMEDKRLNTIEYFNETMIMMVMYCLICFTDFLPDPETKSTIGLVCQGFVIFHIVFNLSFLFGDYFLNLKLRYKRWALFRKYAKIRAIKNQKLQKQLRHQRFVQHLKRNQEIQAEKDRKRLHPIREESKDGSGNSSRIGSYDYLKDVDDHGNDSSLFKENSQQDLNYGDHFDMTKGLSRQPVEAPEIQLHRLKEFSDNAGTSDKTQNSRLGLTRPVEFSQGMDLHAHRNLVRNFPYDSIYPEIQAIMNEVDFGDMKEQSHVDKLKRRVNEQPLNLQNLNPLKIVHNKLARMVQHDVSLGSSQVIPERQKQGGLRVLADTEAIHKKLFSKMEAGDGQKDSGTQVYKNSRNNIGKRKEIITYQEGVQQKVNYEITEDSEGNLYGADGNKLIYVPGMKATKPKAGLSKLPTRKEHDDFGEEADELEQSESNEVEKDEINELISEITADEVKSQFRRSQNKSEIDSAHETHIKLFGTGVGKNLSMSQNQEEWNTNEQSKSNFTRNPSVQISRKKGKLLINDEYLD